MSSSNQKNTGNEPIAIIGTGCRFPGGASTPAKLWELLRDPRDVSKDMLSGGRFDHRGFYHPDSDCPGHTNVRNSYLLEENIANFDPRFFNLQPAEAAAMDPQMRILLETVYEGLESAGQTLEGLQGSNTGVYVGMMYQDYEIQQYRDLQGVPSYHGTGATRSMASNRVSYFFDWHGPSLTIDTACSSSLVALHQAVQSLRLGEIGVAVVAGTNLLIGPEPYISESNLKMLSPDGRSRMWGDDANGYARGDGIAAVILKTLSQALEDGDNVECVVRESGVNQDGRSPGITMPTTKAQIALIRDVYQRAGLDLAGPADRCQYVEAHGTGTPAGDPIEAEALHTAFFGNVEPTPIQPIVVGSNKTVIGHTESTAGLAAIVKVSQAMKHGLIPPNGNRMLDGKVLDFTINPRVEPWCKSLQIASKPTPWPEPFPGQPRRASINSFGYGGTNAHVILEGVDESPVTEPESTDVMRSFVFSAQSTSSLMANLRSHAAYLSEHPETSLPDLAWTLHSRRSRLSLRAAIAASSVNMLRDSLETISNSTPDQLRLDQRLRLTSSAAQNKERKTKLLGIFTGQGAQWARMGAQLIESSNYASNILTELDAELANLPVKRDRPDWTLRQEILADASMSRVGEAIIAQPLCTAVQIILVELLRAARVEFAAVVGHSSGEIGAAYWARRLSAADAIRIAYYRGLHSTRLGGGPGGVQGAMLAVTTSMEDAKQVCNDEAFRGRVGVAACNSPQSVTLSGDADAIDEAAAIFEDEGKMARRLRVDKAYHSHHMTPCAQPYLASMEGFESKRPVDSEQSDCLWVSSVTLQSSTSTAGVDASYWIDNLLSPVLFNQAVEQAVEDKGPFEGIVEVGPHPALKGPVRQILEEVDHALVPYTGLLERGKEACLTMSMALGLLWTNLDRSSVDFKGYETALIGSQSRRPGFISSLPLYQWDYSEHWHESNASRRLRFRDTPVHPLLGDISLESSPQNLSWNAVLREQDIPWVADHRIQGQSVFPAAGYVVTALEAAPFLADGRPLRLVEVADLAIHQAMVFDKESVEIRFSIGNVTRSKDGTSVAGHFIYQSYLPSGSAELVASGRLCLTLGEPSGDILPASKPSPGLSMVDISTEGFYSWLDDIGYGYGGPFRALSALKRRLGTAVGMLDTPPALYEEGNRHMAVHPGMLDAAIQSVILAYSFPKDGRLWSLHLPTRIRRIRVNPACCGRQWSLEAVPFIASIDDDQIHLRESSGFSGDVEVHTRDGTACAIQVEGLQVVPFSAATASDDRNMFYETRWVNSEPNADIQLHVDGSQTDRELVEILERGHYFHLRRLQEQIPVDHPGRVDPFNAAYLRWAEHIHRQVQEGKHPHVKSAWAKDTWEDIQALVEPYADRPEVRAMQVVGKEMPRAIRGETSIVQHLEADGLLEHYFSQAAETKLLGDVVSQITRRYPRAKIIEVGAGAGAATREVMQHIEDYFDSFTFTDSSTERLEEGKLSLAEYQDHMSYRVLDLEQDFSSQGFDTETYDIVIASRVLYSTKSLNKALQRVRLLLRPGGYLVLYENTNVDLIRIPALFGCLPGWWEGVEEGSGISPVLSETKWDAILRKTGFSGVDTITTTANPISSPFSVLVSQAVDDWIDFVRHPLTTPSAVPPSALIDKLLIVGGATLQASRLIDGVQRLVQPFCKKSITRVENLEELNEEQIDTSSTVLVTQDLDNPVFVGMTEIGLENLKRLVASDKIIIWVTQNRLVDNPYATMALGFIRTLVWENPELRYQFFDFNGVPPSRFDAHALTESLLRAQAGGSVHSTAKNNALWSVESEIAVGPDGCTLIPRLEPSSKANARYNSSLRSITDHSPRGQENAVTLCGKDEGAGYTLQSRQNGRDFDIQLRTEHSSLFAVRTEIGDVFVVSGTHEATGVQYIGLTPSVTSHASNASVATVEIPGSLSQVSLVTSVISQLVRREIEAKISGAGAVVVHDAPPTLVAALTCCPNPTSITFTTSSHEEAERYSWIHISPYSRQADIRSVLPVDVSLLIDLTAEAPSSSDLVECFGGTLQVLSRPDFFASEPSRKVIDYQATTNILQTAVDSANGARSEIEATDLAVDQMSITSLVSGEGGGASLRSPLTVVDWAEVKSVPVTIQPVSVRLHDDRTYWLFGLSKDLGLSLADWMIRHGAKYIAISSRNPTISPAWLDNAARREANISVTPCDITDYESVAEAHANIIKTMPPIGGVAQGTMVLMDVMIQDMTLGDLDKVLRPKVDGSLNLDRLFYNTPLDFFIFFSSAASVMGNPGQANYSAGNCFMGGLARQRRSRGLAASVMDLGAVFGTGYVAREMSHVADPTAGRGLSAISESDVHCQFAEAINASPVTAASETAWQLTSGLRPLPASVPNRPPWFDIPQFSCMTLRDTASNGTSNTSGGSGGSIEDQLAGANTQEDLQKVITDNLLKQMASMLNVGDDYALTPTVRTDELGLDSLVAVRIRSWILAQFQVNIPALKIIKGTSLQDLVEDILSEIPAGLTPGLSGAYPSTSAGEEAKPASTAPGSETINNFVPSSSDGNTSDTDATEITTTTLPEKKELEIERVGPLSFTQSAFMFVQQLLEDKTTLNNTALLHLRGNLRVDDFKRAVRLLSERHEAMRTCFVRDDGVHSQAVLAEPTLQLEHCQVATKDDVWREYAAFKRTVFNFSSGEMARALLMSSSGRDHYLALAMHHIVNDRASTDIILSDLDCLYRNQDAVLSPPLQYIDYANQLHGDYSSGRYAEAIRYWHEEFETIPDALPLHRSRVTDRRPLEKYSTRTGVPECVLRIDPKLTARIRQVARKCRSTPFHFHLAAVKVLLRRWLGTEDLCIGFSDGSRRDEREWTGVGPFLNMLPLRLKGRASQAFQDAIVESRQKSHEALSNAIPLEVILTELKIPRHATHAPLAQAFVNYAETSTESRRRFLDCDAEMLDEEQAEIPYDIAFTIVTNNPPGGDPDTKITLNLQNSLYDSSAARALAFGYEDILREFAERPGDPIQSEWRFRQPELTKAISVGRGPEFNTTWPDTVVHTLDALLPTMSDCIAVTDSIHRAMTYYDLSRKVNSLAFSLIERGVVAGSRVAIYQDPTVFWVASVIAVLKIGAVYVPLDAATPTARLAVMIQDCKPAAILVNAATQDKAPELGAQIPAINVNENIHDSCDLIPTTAVPNSPAMILYTSGSTGTPKGVILSHDSLRHEFEHCKSVYGLTANDVVLQQSAWSFDLSVTQLFVALTVGARLHVASHTLRADGKAMAELIRDDNVTVTYATPTEYKGWLQDAHLGIIQQSPWRLALVAGEAVTLPLLQRFKSVNRAGSLRLFNVYGPTETTCGSTKMEVDYNSPERYADGVPVGRASANESFYILDDKQNLQTLGLTGEIAIAGVGVAMGYLNNPEQTSVSFVQDPFASVENIQRGWTTMYRTGDVGYLKDDGTLVLKGRLGGDSEVKLNGVRINLGDVEQTILKAAEGQIADVAATIRSKDEVKYMVAYCVLSPNLMSASDTFLLPLLERLPLSSAMRPSVLIPIEVLPRTTAGKLDRRALEGMAAPQALDNTGSVSSSTLSSAESNMLQLWKSVLPEEVTRLVRIGPDSDFFSVGGTSMLLVRLQARISESVLAPVTLLDLFRASTLRGMAVILQPIMRLESGASNAETGKAMPLLNWEEETAVGKEALSSTPQPPYPRSPLRVVVLTGATGFLGQHILRGLLNQHGIEKVICIANRNLESKPGTALLISPRVEYIAGDLSSPNLGLSPSEINRIFNREADAVIHNGADVSHLKTYASLRVPNVESTKRLVQFCLPRRVPLHYVSTTGVTMYTTSTTFPESSAREFPPPRDGTYGYISSKWASEVYLENVSQQHNLPVLIHRPSSILRPDMNEETPAADVLQNMLTYSRRIAAVPLSATLNGYVDLVRPETVTDKLVQAVMTPSRVGNVVYLHESGDIELEVEQVPEYLAKELGKPVQVVPMDEWVRMAEGAGLSAPMAAVFRGLEGEDTLNFPRMLRGV